MCQWMEVGHSKLCEVDDGRSICKSGSDNHVALVTVSSVGYCHYSLPNSLESISTVSALWLAVFDPNAQHKMCVNFNVGAPHLLTSSALSFQLS